VIWGAGGNRGLIRFLYYTPWEGEDSQTDSDSEKEGVDYGSSAELVSDGDDHDNSF